MTLVPSLSVKPHTCRIRTKSPCRGGTDFSASITKTIVIGARLKTRVCQSSAATAIAALAVSVSARLRMRVLLLNTVRVGSTAKIKQWKLEEDRHGWRQRPR